MAPVVTFRAKVEYRAPSNTTKNLSRPLLASLDARKTKVEKPRIAAGRAYFRAGVFWFF